MATSSPRIFKFTSRRSPKLIHLAMSLPSTEDSEEAPNFKGPLKRTSEEEHWQKKLAEEHQPLGKCGWSTQSIGMLWNSMQSIYLVSEIFKCLTGSLTIGTTLNCSSSLEVWSSNSFKLFQALNTLALNTLGSRYCHTSDFFCECVLIFIAAHPLPHLQRCPSPIVPFTLEATSICKQRESFEETASRFPPESFKFRKRAPTSQH